MEYDGALTGRESYRRFLRKAFRYADQICLSCCGLDYEEFAASRWGALADSVTGYEYTVESPVTCGPEVLLLYLNINQVTAKWLLEKDNIYDFWETGPQQGTFLWDLCFVKNRELIFCSCTHERFCSISPELLEWVEV